MIDQVTFLGLATGSVQFGGPSGPEEASPASGEVLAVYKISGWGAEDEAAGHRICRSMERLGNVVRDTSISAADALEVISLLGVDTRNFSDVAKLVDQIFSAVSDDGKVSSSEALSIVWSLASAVGRRTASTGSESPS